MTTVRMEFGLADVVSYFNNRTASEIYCDLYTLSHSGKRKFMFCITETIGDYILMALTQLTRDRDSQLSKEISANLLSDEDITLPLNLKNVGAPPYDALIGRVREVLGKKAVPYLEEYRLLGEYVRTLDVLLMGVHGNVTKNAPLEIRQLLHQDKHTVNKVSFNKFIDWLREQEEKSLQYSVKNVPDEVKPILIPRLYKRIKALASFYNGKKAVTLEESLLPEENEWKNFNPHAARESLLAYLNRIFRKMR